MIYDQTFTLTQEKKGQEKSKQVRKKKKKQRPRVGTAQCPENKKQKKNCPKLAARESKKVLEPGATHASPWQEGGLQGERSRAEGRLRMYGSTLYGGVGGRTERRGGPGGTLSGRASPSQAPRSKKRTNRKGRVGTDGCSLQLPRISRTAARYKFAESYWLSRVQRWIG